jgi:hypothetical protein
LACPASKSDGGLRCAIVFARYLFRGNPNMKDFDHYIYTPATTDVTIRWRTLYGWIPPTQDPAYQRKWANFRKITVAGIESLVDANPLNVKKVISDESLSSNQPSAV